LVEIERIGFCLKVRVESYLRTNPCKQINVTND